MNSAQRSFDAEELNIRLVAVWLARGTRPEWEGSTLDAYVRHVLRFIRSLDGVPLPRVGLDDVAEYLAQHHSAGAFGQALAAVGSLTSARTRFAPHQLGDEALSRERVRLPIALFAADNFARLVERFNTAAAPAHNPRWAAYR